MTRVLTTVAVTTTICDADHCRGGVVISPGQHYVFHPGLNAHAHNACAHHGRIKGVDISRQALVPAVMPAQGTPTV